jgi:hypothetical protein
LNWVYDLGVDSSGTPLLNARFKLYARCQNHLFFFLPQY